jgi:AraC family transcriptional regulator
MGIVAITPRFETIVVKKLVGMRRTLSLAHFNEGELWQTFLPHLKEVSITTSTNLISLAVYPPEYFTNFNPENLFERWAAVEVADFSNIPDAMEKMELSEGLYAVFHYKGLNTDYAIFQYIYGTWLPNSGYMLDDRPHFEVLGDKYKNNDPSSEEEIWIPVIEE